MQHREGAGTTTIPDGGDATTTELAALPMPIEAGMVIDGKYLVDGVLGAGGMGIVVAARHLHLRRDVAIKFLLPDVAADRETVERFFREAQAASRIRNEHVVRVLDVGTLERHTPYMVMEMLEGRDLAAELQANGPLPVQHAVDWILQAMEALAEAHAAGVVHRDLKPSNLFLTRRADGTPFVKVLDFGLCKDVSSAGESASLTRSSTGAMGSPLYMAPEQVRSARNATFASDVWSLGVTLHELVTNDVPFEGETVGAVLGAIMTDPPRPLRSQDRRLPERLEQVVLRCLVKDAAGRHRDLADLAHALLPLASPAGAVSVERIVGTLGRVDVRSDATRAATAPSPLERPAAVARSPGPSAGNGVAPRGSLLAVGALLGVAAVVGVALVAMWPDTGPATSAVAPPSSAEGLGNADAAPSAPRAEADEAPPTTPSAEVSAAPSSVPAPSAAASTPRRRARPPAPPASPRPTSKPTLEELVEQGRR